MTPVSPTAVARHLSFVRETQGPNRGAWVEFFQRFNGGQPGESWCADFLGFVLDIAWFGKSPLKRSGSCAVLLENARLSRFIVNTPAIDDLYFYVNDAGHAHHVGIVTGLNPLTGIAGNTSEDGQSSNGIGVFEHAISGRMVFVRLPR